MRRLICGFPRGDLARLHLGERFLLRFRTSLAFGIELCLAFAVGFFAHFLLDQHARLRLYLRFFFCLEFGLHFGLYARAICRFLARPRFQALAILRFELLPRFGFRFGGAACVLFGFQTHREFGRRFGRCRRLRFSHLA